MRCGMDTEPAGFGDTEDELLGVDAREVGGSKNWKRGIALGAGVLLLAGCASVAYQSVVAQDANTQVTARTLLESRELSDVVVQQLVAVAGREDTDQEGLRDQVHSGFQDISQRISAELPATARQLDETQLSPEQKAAVLQSYHSMADPRVLRLGLDILQAASESGDVASLKERMLSVLTPRADEIRQLRDQIMPGQAGQAVALANVGNMDIVRNFDKWHVEVSVAAGKASKRKLMGLLPTAGMPMQAQVFMGLLGAVKPDFQVPDLSGLQEDMLSDCFACLSTSLSSMALVEAATCVSTYFAQAVNYLRSSFGG